MTTDPPVDIRLQTRSKCLALTWADGVNHALSFEYLRVQSPSAEVRGHGPGQGTLPVGKREVRITRIDPVGHYALRLHFSDGHDSGLYSWSYLRQIGDEHDRRWRDYEAALAQSGRTRDPDASAS